MDPKEIENLVTVGVHYKRDGYKKLNFLYSYGTSSHLSAFTSEICPLQGKHLYLHMGWGREYISLQCNLQVQHGPLVV
jgi:hypothetical protein